MLALLPNSMFHSIMFVAWNDGSISIMETVKDREAWHAAVHGVTKSDTRFVVVRDWTTTKHHGNWPVLQIWMSWWLASTGSHCLGLLSKILIYSVGIGCFKPSPEKSIDIHLSKLQEVGKDRIAYGVLQSVRSQRIRHNLATEQR